jgi:O-antigen ligase
MAMSRSSGVARFAAVPGIVAFAMLFYGRSKWRFLWLLPFGLFTGMIVAMQSRGGLFGFAAALGLVFVLHKGRILWIILMVVVLGLAVTLDEALPEKVSEYVRRGQSAEGLYSMTGRTRAWDNAIDAFGNSPLIGRGHWADRFVIGEHVHNAPLQALLSAGIVGVVPFLASWAAGWRLFIRLMRRWQALSGQQRILLIQAGSVLTFFTVRSIPETTTASISVDLLVMIPVFAYLETLDRELSRPRPAMIPPRPVEERNRGGRTT